MSSAAYNTDFTDDDHQVALLANLQEQQKHEAQRLLHDIENKVCFKYIFNPSLVRVIGNVSSVLVDVLDFYLDYKGGVGMRTREMYVLSSLSCHPVREL